jgi:hypothetical protein
MNCLTQERQMASANAMYENDYGCLVSGYGTGYSWNEGYGNNPWQMQTAAEVLSHMAWAAVRFFAIRQLQAGSLPRLGWRTPVYG